MSTQAPEHSYRIGEVAERVGVTTRTIRYYEEFGLLGTAAARTKGAHRLYTETDIARLEELIRLRDLLGLSLDELVALAEAEEARAALRGLIARATGSAPGSSKRPCRSSNGSSSSSARAGRDSPSSRTSFPRNCSRCESVKTSSN